jgi:hypothetical protein
MLFFPLALALACVCAPQAMAAFDAPQPAGWPNDPYLQQQWYWPALGMKAVWDANVTGDPDVNVTDDEPMIALIDSGIDYDHPDFAGAKIIKGPNYVHSCKVAGEAVAVDSTGHPLAPYTDVDCDAGTGPTNPLATDPMDDYGHGTHLAGLIVAQTDNYDGSLDADHPAGDIAGLAPGVRLLAIKAAGAGGQNSEPWTAAGIRYAVDHGADIVSLSYESPDPQPNVHSALQYAAANDVLVICAAGNSGGWGVFYPASYDECMSVGEYQPSGEIGRGSSVGSAVDISAPGSRITTLDPGGRTISNGTSLAAPLVAAAAALVLSENPSMTASQLRSRLIATSTDAGPEGWDDHYGAGQLNVARALGLDETSPAPTCASQSVQTIAGQSVTVSFSCGYGGAVREWCSNLVATGFVDFGCIGDYAPENLTVSSPPAHGSILPEWDESQIDHTHGLGGDVVYVPASGFTGTDTFSVRVNDGSRTSQAATVTVTISAPPDPPQDTISCQGVSMTTSVSVSTARTASCTSALSLALTMQIVSQPGKGTAAISGGSIIYTPAAGMVGSDSFTWHAVSASGQSQTMTVPVTITRQKVTLARPWIACKRSVRRKAACTVRARVPALAGGGRAIVTIQRRTRVRGRYVWRTVARFAAVGGKTTTARRTLPTGSYRLRTSVAATALHTAAASSWRARIVR